MNEDELDKIELEIIRLYQDGYSAKRIAEELHLPYSCTTVLQTLRFHGIRIRKANDFVKEVINECKACGKKFKGKPSHVYLCAECAPDQSWVTRFRTYGITKVQFDKLLEKQSGLCDLCELLLPSDVSKIHIDHCHKQNYVRALLCGRCNNGLGYVEDDKFLARAIRYIEKHKR